MKDYLKSEDYRNIDKDDTYKSRQYICLHNNDISYHNLSL